MAPPASCAWEARAQQLLEAVSLAPDDDGARLVLADRLSELGDPQGELISIQVSSGGARPKGLARLRERELLHLYRPRWVPPGAVQSSAVFKRGLLHSCTWFGPTDPGHPGWQTVERLTCLGFQAGKPRQGPFWASSRPALRSVAGASERTLLAMANCRLPCLGWLSLELQPDHLLSLVVPWSAFPALHTLHLNAVVEPDGQWPTLLGGLEKALAGKVREVRLHVSGLVARAAAAARAQRPPGLGAPGLRVELADASGDVAVL